MLGPKNIFNPRHCCHSTRKANRRDSFFKHENVFYHVREGALFGDLKFLQNNAFLPSKLPLRQAPEIFRRKMSLSSDVAQKNTGRLAGRKGSAKLQPGLVYCCWLITCTRSAV